MLPTCHENDANDQALIRIPNICESPAGSGGRQAGLGWAAAELCQPGRPAQPGLAATPDLAKGSEPPKVQRFDLRSCKPSSARSRGQRRSSKFEASREQRAPSSPIIGYSSIIG